MKSTEKAAKDLDFMQAVKWRNEIKAFYEQLT
ncbi:UvrB/UvrC motif-containing protein [Flavobacterium sp.]